MSKARVCDHCDEVIVLNDRGDDDAGESSAWLTVGTLDGALRLEACSRSCAVELLADDSPLSRAIEERLAAVSEIARILSGEDDE